MKTVTAAIAPAAPVIDPLNRALARAVVDPQVGAALDALVLEADTRRRAGPANGLLSSVQRRHGRARCRRSPARRDGGDVAKISPRAVRWPDARGRRAVTDHAIAHTLTVGVGFD